MKAGAAPFWRQPWFWAAVILPGALGLAQFTQFRAKVSIFVEADKIRAVVEGQELTAPVRAGRVASVAALAAQPFEQFGGGGFSVDAPGQPREEVTFPSQWPFPSAKKVPVGDWWVDSPVDETQFSKLGSVHGTWAEPFRVDVEIPGRLSRPLVIRFDGDVRFDFAIRYGLINNDVSFYFPDSEPHAFARPIGAVLATSRRGVVGPIAKGIVLGCLLILAFSLVAALDRTSRPLGSVPGGPGRWLAFAVVLLVLARFAVSGWVADDVLSRLPHFQDDFCYVLRAQWLVAGSHDRPIPALQSHFQMPFTAYLNNRWVTPFPIVWSMLLALGLKLGAMWLVAPLCGALAVIIQFRLGNAIAGGVVGALGALLLALSPFALILSGSMLNHTATGMFLALFAWLFVKGWGREREVRHAWLILSGIALGCAFGIRPLTAAAMGVPTFFLGLYEWKRRRFSLSAFGGLVVFALGVGLGSLPTLADNAEVTGNPLLFGYYYLNNSSQAMSELLPTGMFWSDRSMAQFPMLITGWGWPWWRGEWWICLPFGLVAVPFLTGRANRFDWWLLGLFASVVAAHFSHAYGTLHGFGPRLYADTLFAVFFLVARGWDVLSRMKNPFQTSAEPGIWTRWVAYGLPLSLCLSTAFTLRARLERYRGYNDVDGNSAALVDRIGVKRALVLLRPDAMLKWIRLANHVPLDPMKADIVFAEMRGDNAALLKAYGSDRPVFILEDRTLVPYAPPK